MKNYHAYEEVVARLVEYRKKITLTQYQMGIRMNVTQSHYNKLETGMKVISRDSLLHFLDNGGDVQWLITGKEIKLGVFDHYLKLYQDYRLKAEFLEIVLWIIGQGLRIAYTPKTAELMNIYRIMWLLRYRSDGNSLWKSIREVENLTQVQMADLLEIGIKRYRRLEIGEAEEDAEILTSLYVNLGYSPMLMLKDDIYCISELNMIWDTFDRKLQDRLLQYVEKGTELIEYGRGESNEEENSAFRR